MKKKFSLKKLGAIGAGAVMALSLAFGMAFTDLSKDTVTTDEANENVTQTVNEGTSQKEVSTYATTITYPSGSYGMGQFPVNYYYTFTDKTKVTDYRSRKIDSDMTTIKITNSTHGSQTNPYVIATNADWESFVKYVTASDSTRGSGKFFVLVNDLDFKGVTDFHACPFFSGTFYGLGHTISNVTNSTWKYWNNTAIGTATMGYGLFCRLTNATITDLNVDNYTYSNQPETNTHGSRGSAVGGLAGYSWGNDTILNCHTNGKITSTYRYSWHVPIGGSSVRHIREVRLLQLRRHFIVVLRKLAYPF